jgi:hypothetical protein
VTFVLFSEATVKTFGSNFSQRFIAKNV